MYKILSKFLLAGLVSLLFISCGSDIEETISIDENLAGSYEVKTDMIPMMRSMAYQFAELASNMDGNDSVGGKIDSAKIEAQIFKDFPNEVDSIIPLHKMTKEATLSKEDKAKLEKQLKLFMKGGKKSGTMIMGMNYTFHSIPDLNEFGAIMERNKETQEDSKINRLAGNASYVWQGNTLSRSYRKTQKTSGEQEENEERLKALMSENTYFRTTIHSKRKIKSVQGSFVKTKQDHLIIFEYPMKAYLNGEAQQDFSIELE